MWIRGKMNMYKCDDSEKVNVTICEACNLAVDEDAFPLYKFRFCPSCGFCHITIGKRMEEIISRAINEEAVE